MLRLPLVALLELILLKVPNSSKTVIVHQKQLNFANPNTVFVLFGLKYLSILQSWMSIQVSEDGDQTQLFNSFKFLNMPD